MPVTRPSTLHCRPFPRASSGEQREQAQALVERKGALNVKYTPFNFQCRYPTRLRDESLADLGAYGTSV